MGPDSQQGPSTGMETLFVMQILLTFSREDSSQIKRIR